MDILPRPVATDRDSTYSLTIEQAADFYAKAGHPRTLRTIQRYCATGHLDSVKVATTLGDKYFVSPQSVSRHIAQIAELGAFDKRAADRDLTRPAATTDTAQQPGDLPRQGSETGRDLPASVTRLVTELGSVEPTPRPDRSRPTATLAASVSQPDASQSDGLSDRSDETLETRLDARKYVAQLERENDMLHKQLDIKDDQIGNLTRVVESTLENFKQQNILIQGFQKMFGLAGPKSDGGSALPQ